MHYIDRDNSIGIKEQNRRNNIRKTSQFKAQGKNTKF